MKQIHVIGDSHVTLFSGKDEIVPEWPTPHVDDVRLFKTYRLGAYLAYNVGNENHPVREKLQRLLKSLPKNPKVLLCFGEIDCRAHIVKQAQIQGKAIYITAIDTAEAYMQGIRAIKPLCGVLGVWGAPPQSPAEHSSNRFPTVGTMKERNIATWHFNQRLSVLCDEEGVFFAHVHNEIVNESAESNPDYFMDSAHLNQRARPFAMNVLTPFLNPKLK